jgi:probable rRNA maturation factor
MPVDVSDSAASGTAASIRRAAERLLSLLHRPKAELSVVLCDDAAIRELNRDWRKKDRATDVLSFPQAEDDAALHAGRKAPADASLGDVVISVDTARRQAHEGGWTLEEEMNRLLLHGVLHLLGYDHERGTREAARMRAEEARLSAALVADGVPCARETGEG